VERVVLRAETPDRLPTAPRAVVARHLDVGDENLIVALRGACELMGLPHVVPAGDRRGRGDEREEGQDDYD
jgi:hypothetical protein